MRLFTDSDAAVPGINSMTLSNISGAPKENIALDSYDVFYWTPVRLESGFDQLEFVHYLYVSLILRDLLITAF